MSFDPKITKVGPNMAPAPVTGARQAPAGAEIHGKDKTVQPPLAAPDLDAARAVSKQKEAEGRVMPRIERGGSSRIEQRFAELEQALARKTAARASAAKSAIAFCASFAARGSRGARSRAGALCDMLAEVAGEEASADALRAGLSLDEALQAADAEGVLVGLTAAAMVDEGADATARALMLALASQGVALLAEHFPVSFGGDDAPLEQAFQLAEEALSLGPEVAEAHVALAQLVLLHGDHEAMRDAETLLRRALTLEPEHETAHLALATLAYCRHDAQQALTILSELQSPRPLSLLLMARAQRAVRAYDDAAATLERAIAAAPGLAVMHIEAAVIAGITKNEASAARHRERAAELLGPTIDVDSAIALCFAGHSS